MRKPISYYFSDLKRVDDLPREELLRWIDELPYSQPLHKLLEIKDSRSTVHLTQAHHENAAYHTTDIDKIRMVESVEVMEGKKESGTLEVDESGVLVNTLNVVERESSETEEILGAQESDTLTEKKSLPTVSHELANDTLEDQVEAEIMEESEIIDFTYLDSVIDANYFVEEVIEDTESQDVSVEYDETLESDVDIVPVEALVDVANYSVDVDKKKDKKKKKKKAESKKKSKKGKSEKSKSKKKSKPEVNLKKEKTQKTTSDDKPSAKVLKTKKKKKKTDVVVRKLSATKKSKKKSDNKKKASKSPASSIKPVAKEIRYIYLEERQPKKYRIYEYDGPSEYIKWLMQTKSINKENQVGNKKKKSKKEKKEKGIKKIVLKAAEESVKKRDVVISETLADILAQQGHDKKAKKMYKQLSLIFPEKSSFFAAKIKQLKKK